MPLSEAVRGGQVKLWKLKLDVATTEQQAARNRCSESCEPPFTINFLHSTHLGQLRLRGGGCGASTKVVAGPADGDDQGGGCGASTKVVPGPPDGDDQASRPAPGQDAATKVVVAQFLNLPPAQMRLEIDVKIATSLRDDLLSSEHRSPDDFEMAIERVVMALGPLVGQPHSEEATCMLLELARLLVFGIGAGERRSAAKDIYPQAAGVAALKKPAGRAALMQARKGCSSAEQSMHLALLEACVRSLPRPAHCTVVATKALKLALSVAKSAATMSLDANLLNSLKDCAQLAGKSHSPAVTDATDSRRMEASPILRLPMSQATSYSSASR